MPCEWLKNRVGGSDTIRCQVQTDRGGVGFTSPVVVNAQSFQNVKITQPTQKQSLDLNLLCIRELLKGNVAMTSLNSAFPQLHIGPQHNYYRRR